MNVSGPISAEDPTTVQGPGLDGAIDFVNTTGLSKGKPFEELPSAGAAVHWLMHTGYLTREEAAEEQVRFERAPDKGASALRRVWATRAGLRDVMDALAEDRAPKASALDAVNAALRRRESVQLV